MYYTYTHIREYRLLFVCMCVYGKFANNNMTYKNNNIIFLSWCKSKLYEVGH